ncbi:hypothetical protein JYG23_11360 [Sedimentibacter sp. zth1]|uniref:DUF308 domain-containing protein n=1 Tax=Sedimentibacter sp. zth1 TaxID=2816908 RepID=UPI001A91C528|nr:DUF308 domain-containing protein [Sedimentibacter sp. zth1]QSX05269.1 hypothetical protein JYG23_11360 [Sedimentibacter sp. zth1]
MFFKEFDNNFKPQTLKMIALITSIIGVFFVLFAKYVGNIAIRISMIVIFAVMFLNIKMTYSYSGKIKKSSDVLTMLATVIVFIWPNLLVFILGLCLLYFSSLSLAKMIKLKSYNDKLKLIISIVGIILSIVCIFNSKTILATVIKLLGAILIAVGCFCFYQYMKSTRNEENELSNVDQYKFDNAEEIKEDK